MSNNDRRTPAQRFLAGLLVLKGPPDLHARMRIYDKPFVSARSSITGLRYYYYVGQKFLRCELYIDTSNATNNNRIFDKIARHKRLVEKKFGGPLLWERLDHRKACRISFTIPVGVTEPESKWQKMQVDIVDSMIRLEDSLRQILVEIVGQRREF